MVLVWIRRLFRPDGKPIEGLVWKKRLSIAYALISWHLFIGVVYYSATGKKNIDERYGFNLEDPEPAPEAVSWARRTKATTAKVYRFSGFQNQGGYTIIDGEIEDNDDNLVKHQDKNLNEDNI